MYNITHKIQLQLSKPQEQYCIRAAGIQRFTYNLALSKWNELYEADKISGIKRSAIDYQSLIQKWVDANKREQWPWMMEISKGVPQGGIQNLTSAFIRFFKKTSKYPKFKKKGRCADSFRADGNTSPKNTVKFSNKYVKFTKMPGWIRMSEKLRFEGKIQKVVITRDGVKWFAIFYIETNKLDKIVCETQAAIGVDLGIKHLAVLSNGETFEAPKPLQKAAKQLARAQRAFARRPKLIDENGNKRDSNRRIKARDKIRKIYYRMKCIRQNALHQLSSHLVTNYAIIGIEDLNVQGMAKNHCLSKAILDIGWGELRRQLEYKAKLYNRQVVVIDRFYPSSKTCSECGHVLESLSLSVRKWECPSCAAKHDRDINAAKNIAKEALRVNCPEVKHVEKATAVRNRKGYKQVASKKREVLSTVDKTIVGGY